MARSVREIDRNEDKFVGITFPLDHSPEGFFFKSKTVLEQAKDHTKHIIKETKKEIALFDDPMDQYDLTDKDNLEVIKDE